MSPRESLSKWRQRQRATELAVDAAVAEVKAEETSAWDNARNAARKAQSERVTFTRDDLEGADLVRTKFGWYRVVRINEKTVTIETGHSWTDRVLFSSILEHRTLGGVG